MAIVPCTCAKKGDSMLGKITDRPACLLLLGQLDIDWEPFPNFQGQGGICFGTFCNVSSKCSVAILRFEARNPRIKHHPCIIARPILPEAESYSIGRKEYLL